MMNDVEADFSMKFDGFLVSLPLPCQIQEGALNSGAVPARIQGSDQWRKI
jgi:hypothetical protein